MKKFLALLVICAMLMTTLASCNLFNKNCTEHVDANEDKVCDVCGADLTNPEPPVCEEHKDEDGDEKCDECGADVPKPQPPVCDEHKDEDGDEKCDVCGADVPKPQPPACEEHVDANDDYKCDVCGVVAFERVQYTLNISDLEIGLPASDLINGVFTIVANTEISGREKKYNEVTYYNAVKMASGAIKVKAPGNGTLKFIVQNGSSGATVQYVKITAPDGTESQIEIPGTTSGSPTYMAELAVTEGEWTIQRVSGTIYVFYLELDCKVKPSPESGFEIVAKGETDFLVGDTFTTDDVRLNAKYENGKTSPISNSDVTFDTSKVDMTKSGEYDVTVSYKDYAPITYKVRVFAPESLEFGFDAVEKIGNSGAGNGVYYNHSFKELYFVGEELDTAGLSVIVVAKCGDASIKFRVTDYEITGFSSAEKGPVTLTVTSNGVSETIEIYITDTQPTPNEDGVVKALVDPNYESGFKGDLSGEFHVFTTIQQALDYLAHVDASVAKELNIDPGFYNEKLEITIPNLTIIGCGKTPDEVVIEWDSFYGLSDDGGFIHTTDSTQTVAVRESATNVTIKNITISNYYNSQDRMDEAGLAIERGLALLVQADAFIMKDSRLLGIQDTLELFTGRQYFENVYISGYTDFIFGTNSTTYFKNCTIHVINTEKDDKGTAGYITAFKGSNKGGNDAIVYGAIFDGCKFTGDAELTPGCTAIGRTWGAYAAVAVMNSELGGHISTSGYDPANNKNKRYISMNGIHPTDSTVQFVEYNNTGDGAIAAEVAGMRMLTAEEAALYTDFKVIYGTVNGKITYLDAWDPFATEVAVDDRVYYYFNQASAETGTSHTFDITTSIATGSTLEWEGLLISAENGNVAWNSNANALNMKAGGFISFEVEAGTTVIVTAYPNYNYFELNGVASTTDTIIQHYAEDTTVTLLSCGDSYLNSIIINPDEGAPETVPTLESIKVEGMNVNYIVGNEISYEGIVVKAYYSDNTVRTITDYDVDASAVNTAESGEYGVVFSFGGKSITVVVTYENPDSDPAITESTVLDFTSVDGYNAVVNNKRVTLDGAFRFNTAEYQITGTISFQVKAGTVVTVIPYGNSQYVSYTLTKLGEKDSEIYNTSMGMMFDEDCTVVYTGLSNNYLCQIIIQAPMAGGKYVFGGSSIEGDVTGILSSQANMDISGTCKTHSGGAQLGENSMIQFSLAPLASLTVKGYDTQYGQLDVFVDGVPLEMDANACYNFKADGECHNVLIYAKNTGTEESPNWSKSYITYIEIDMPDVYLTEDTNISFGSAGNYKDSIVDFSGITIGDNGGNNAQIKNGSFSFAVKKGAVVVINGYPGHTDYNLTVNGETYENINAEAWQIEAFTDTEIVISHGSSNGNNYFYSISITYPVVAAKENVSISFGSEGNYKEGNAAVDLSNIEIGDNGGNNSQVKNGTITITVYAGGTLTIKGYSNYTDYTLNDGTNDYVVNKDTANHTEYTYVAESDVTVTVTPNSGNNYFYGIEITY